jgi:hypothetical protein
VIVAVSVGIVGWVDIEGAYGRKSLFATKILEEKCP